MNRIFSYFSKKEWLLWSVSIGVIFLSYLSFRQESPMKLTASLVGVTSLIFCAKGNPFGQILMIIFGILYGIISYSFRYYGEMLTYLGMSVPMAVYALVSWLRNPYHGKKSQVAVNRISKKEWMFLIVLTMAVTGVFYFVLKYFETANLGWSTISVTTSFLAAYLTARRSPYYALCYALNDVVLIVLWMLASFHDLSYLSVIVCFVVFLVNDLYGFFNWRNMEKQQR